MWSQHPPELQNTIPSSRNRYVDFKNMSARPGNTVCGDSSNCSTRESRFSLASQTSGGSAATFYSEDEHAQRCVQLLVHTCKTPQQPASQSTVHTIATLKNVALVFEDDTQDSTSVRVIAYAHGDSLWRSENAGWKARHVEVALDMAALLLKHVHEAAKAVGDAGCLKVCHVSHEIGWNAGMCWGGDASYDPRIDGDIVLSGMVRWKRNAVERSECMAKKIVDALCCRLSIVSSSAREKDTIDSRLFEIDVVQLEECSNRNHSPGHQSDLEDRHDTARTLGMCS